LRTGDFTTRIGELKQIVGSGPPAARGTVVEIIWEKEGLAIVRSKEGWEEVERVIGKVWASFGLGVTGAKGFFGVTGIETVRWKTIVEDRGLGWMKEDGENEKEKSWEGDAVEEVEVDVEVMEGETVVRQWFEGLRVRG
jgi:hypothetical protein